MSPSSFAYMGFLLAGVLLYHAVPQRVRKIVLLALSVLFYGINALRFVPLLLATIVFNFALAQRLERAKRRCALLILGLTVDLGALGLFKYLGFFGELVNLAGGAFGLPTVTVWQLALPIGISFYTFVLCGYLIDVYRGRPAERNPLDFALFASFFPAILSGPIERSDHLLPQLRQLRRAKLEDVQFAAQRIIMGLAKKLLLADNLAILVNTAYADPMQSSGLQLAVAAAAYSLQIYCDFAAYSDMAVGSARLFGISLIENFRAPYLAQSSKEFWHRWHISLSTWFRDYLYFPLGGSRRGKGRTYLNILIVFALSGLWHGAALKFVLWGLLFGIFQVIGAVLLPYKKRLCAALSLDWDAAALRVLRTLICFVLSTVAWVFFRADTARQAMLILSRIVTCAGINDPMQLAALGLSWEALAVLAICVLVLLTVDVVCERVPLRDKLLATVWPRYAVWVVVLAAVALFGAYGTGYNAQEFVYFQF